MEKLKATLNKLKLNLKNENLSEEVLNNLYNVYPFNRLEYIISHLLAEKIISLDDYLQIRSDYIKRNKFLDLFEITSPRGFGEIWAQRHLNQLVQELEIPSKKYDNTYHGEYDFFLPIQDYGIKIEVKASRAVDAKSNESLVMKALSYDSKKQFNMNFQQLKPSCCDVFVWIGVWTDKILYWVLSSKDVINHAEYSKNQHGKGFKEVPEGQLWITNKNINSFQKYEVTPSDLLTMIILKGNLINR